MVTPPKVRDKVDMKLHNRAMIWELIISERPVSRARLAKMTEMSPTSITRIVGELIGFGLLVEMPDTHVGVGRKATLLDIDRDAVFTVGVDIDVHSLRTCLLDLDNKTRIIIERGGRDGAFHSPETVAETALDMYGEMLSAAGVPAGRVKAVGVSVGGTVDAARGVVTVSPQLHWKNVELRDVVERAFGIPVIVENDVKAAIFEEHILHPECRVGNVAYLTIGSGIGAAVMYGGRLLRGGGNAAGEIGHTTVQPGGELCDCGRYGCLYTCLGEKHLLAKIRRLTQNGDGIHGWLDALDADEPWATGLANETAGYIAMALNQILCSYDPSIIIVGGRLIHAAPTLLELALGKRGLIYDELGSDARIIPSFSPIHDALVGAAIMARSAYLDRLLHEKE